MRKLLTVGLISFVLIVSFSAQARADNALEKLGRGIANIVTSPLELFIQMGRVNKSDGPAAGLTYGLLKGIGMIGVRAAVGAYEVASFPIPFPRYYEPILTDPEYVFEEMSW